MREQRTVMDAFSNPSARMGWGTQNLLEGTQYPLTRLSFNYILLQSLYRSNWIARKVIDLPAEDMTKNWVSLQTEIPPAQIKKFENTVRLTQTQNQILQTLKWARLFGGAAAIMIIEGDEDRLDEPLDLDDVEIGSYRGLIPLDRWSGISPSLLVCSDINRPIDFGLPEHYRVNVETGKSFSIHSSRVVRFIGRDVPTWEKQVEQYWGISEIEVMYDEMKKRDNTSWNVASLVFRANIIALKQKDLSQMLSGISASPDIQNRFYSVLAAQSQLMSNQGLMVLPEDGGLDEHQYAFGGIRDVEESQKENICGATGIPYSRMFGRPPGGLATTNEGDEHMYYEGISAKQAREVNPQVQKLFPVIAMSTWGAVPDDFDWRWNPVRSLSNEARSNLAKEKSDAVVAVFGSQLCSQRMAMMELKQQSDETGMWSNITDEDIEAADDEIQDPMEALAQPAMGGEGEAERGGDLPASPKKREAEDAEAERPILDHPIGEDGLFVQPDTRSWSSERKAKHEQEETHNRQRFAKKFDYADPWEGDARTYDPAGNYVCGTCNQHKGTECELLGSLVVLSLKAGSCAKYEDESAGDPELDFGSKGVATLDQVGYGVAKNGKGFGCRRCPFASKAYEPDSMGRGSFCGKGYFRVIPTACCALNGAEVLAQPKKAQDSLVKIKAVDALEAKNWNFQGLRINIENLRGSVRQGDGWSVKMTVPYGYIQRTEGVDGDEVDVFVGPVLNAPYVYVIHTRSLETGDYDEDKVLVGFESAREAQTAFVENYDKPDFFDSMERLTVAELKTKLKALRGRKLVAG